LSIFAILRDQKWSWEDDKILTKILRVSRESATVPVTDHKSYPAAFGHYASLFLPFGALVIGYLAPITSVLPSG
jgi:hypothetical protein